MAIRLTNTPGQLKLTPAPRSRTRSRSALLPAAARTPTAFTETELALSGDAIETFAAACGGREKLLETLAVADADGGNDKVINCLLDPNYAGWSLRRICAYAGITVAELFASYKKALFARAHIEAAHTITSKLPPIVEDVMMRAAPMALLCPRCQGRPTQEGGVDCPVCAGSGTVLSEPDLDRQKLALELGRLTAQRAGVMVQQNQITAAAAGLASQGTGSLEQLQQAVGDLLFAPGRRRAASPGVGVGVIDQVVVEAEHVSVVGPDPGQDTVDVAQGA